MATLAPAPDPSGILRRAVEKAVSEGRYQKDIAREAGMSAPQLTRLIKGERTIHHDPAVDLDRVLGLKGDLVTEATAYRRYLRDRTMPRYLCRLILTAFPAFSPSPAVASA